MTVAESLWSRERERESEQERERERVRKQALARVAKAFQSHLSS